MSRIKGCQQNQHDITPMNLEEQYIEKHLETLFRAYFIKACLWGALLFTVFSLLDGISTPENFKLFLYYRINITAILVLFAVLSRKMTNWLAQRIIAYAAIASSAITLELMILQFGGHASPYYAGMILLGVCFLSFIPGKFSFHVTSTLLIYSVYLVPILIVEQITDYQTFFMSNFFILSIFSSALVLQYFGTKSLINELKLKFKLETAVTTLHKSEQKYRSLVESTEDSIYLVDRNMNYLFINEKHMERMGVSDSDYGSRTFGDYHSSEDIERFTAKLNKVFQTGRSLQNEYKSRRDGKYFLQTLSPVFAPDGETEAVTVVSKNITKIKQMEEELRSLSLTDVMTGLYNRRGFLTLVEQQFKIADRNRKGFYILYADLDNLKKINDTCGHKDGDAAIIEAADILKNSYRKSDIIARIGGDEFVVLPVGTSEDSIEVITRRFYKKVEEHNRNTDGKHRISLSAGAAFYDPMTPSTVDDILSQADKLLYEEKRKKQKALL